MSRQLDAIEQFVKIEAEKPVHYAITRLEHRRSTMLEIHTKIREIRGEK